MYPTVTWWGASGDGAEEATSARTCFLPPTGMPSTGGGGIITLRLGSGTDGGVICPRGKGDAIEPDPSSFPFSGTAVNHNGGSTAFKGPFSPDPGFVTFHLCAGDAGVRAL